MQASATIGAQQGSRRERLNPRCLPAALLLVLSLTSCASRPEHVEIVPSIPTGAAAGSSRTARYEAALASVLDVLESEVGLPRVEVALVLFPNRRAFKQGLLQIGYPESLARSASSFNAIGGARAVLVNAELVDRLPRARRIQLLAHEVVHTVQYHFSGGTRGTSEQWLREGFADWVACRVAAGLGFGSFETLRAELLERLAGAPVALSPAPFEKLATFPQWVEAQGRYDAPLYVQAFLAAELLIELHGVPAVIRYFELFKNSQDRERAFRETFGVDRASFARQFMRRWRETLVQVGGQR